MSQSQTAERKAAVTQAPAPHDPGRTIYSVTGPTFEAVQLEIENLMERVSFAHFSVPFLDRQQKIWIAYGVARIACEQRSAAT